MPKPIKVPKYIKKKIEQQNKYLDQARTLRHEIEKWAESVGCDVCSGHFHNEVTDYASGVEPFDADSLQSYINNTINNKEESDT